MDIWVPVFVALATGVVAWIGVIINHELARRDLRSQIKADHELYNELGEGFRKRSLKESIDARVRQLAEESMPLPLADRLRILLYRTTGFAGIVFLVFGSLMGREVGERMRAKNPDWVAYPWFYDNPTPSLMISLLGGALLGVAVPSLLTKPVEARKRRLNARLQNGPGSAGTPPDPADTA
ncbi:hypothetical protein [Rhodococcus pyridinivorans]|uniref:hypothetical protein n=1 Tax=Rhodococcus pyridinivorans TaxID=103816 RepID=UPI0022851BB8|nr:hypothetical protein [Rhodococcus pyridinivorans]WAL48273.1 hypothetical protein OQN32_09495 [Rhodococcus pyridinivorans]